MGYQKLTDYLGSLFPSGDTWLLHPRRCRGRAGPGPQEPGRERSSPSWRCCAPWCFGFAPQARLWNARVLPFWFLCLYLLAGVAFMEAGTVLVEHLRTPELRRGALIGVPIVTGVIAFGWVNYPLHNLPFGHESASGKYIVDGDQQHGLVFCSLLGLLELFRLSVRRKGPREGVLRPRRRDDQAGPESGLRVRASHVGVRARAGPDGHP